MVESPTWLECHSATVLPASDLLDRGPNDQESNIIELQQ